MVDRHHTLTPENGICIGKLGFIWTARPNWCPYRLRRFRRRRTFNLWRKSGTLDRGTVSQAQNSVSSGARHAVQYGCHLVLVAGRQSPQFVVQVGFQTAPELGPSEASNSTSQKHDQLQLRAQPSEEGVLPSRIRYSGAVWTPTWTTNCGLCLPATSTK